MRGKKKTIEEFAADLERVHGSKIRLAAGAEYTGAHKPINVECQVCSHEWAPLANNLLNGVGCSECAIQRSRNSAGTLRTPRASEAEKTKARELRAEGLSYGAIGAQLGRSDHAIRKWCDPAQAEKARQRDAIHRRANREHKRALQRRYYHETEHGNAGVKRHRHARRGITEEWNEEENAYVTSYEPTPTGEDLERFNLINKQLQQWNAKDDGVEYWLEHLLPTSQGGSGTGWWNLSVTTKAENLSKGSKIDPTHMALRRHKLLKMFNEN